MCVSRNIGSRTLFPILGLSLALNIQISLCKTISYIFNNFIIMGEIVHLALFVDYLKPLCLLLIVAHDKWIKVLAS